MNTTGAGTGGTSMFLVVVIVAVVVVALNFHFSCSCLHRLNKSPLSDIRSCATWDVGCMTPPKIAKWQIARQI